MAVQTLTLGGKRFVIMPEAEYRKMKANVARKQTNGRPSKAVREDAADLAEHRRRLGEGGLRPYSELRKELGVVVTTVAHRRESYC